MRATIRDVSREAGVSIKTVSRVLNNERYVGAETRARVEAAVAALRFRPNGAARALAGARSGRIALVGDAASPDATVGLFAGLRERCAADAVRATLHPVESDAPLGEVEALVDATPFDGLVLTAPAGDDRAVLALLAEREVRVVRVSPRTDLHATPSVAIDEARAAAEMTAYLIALGHRRIACLAGPAGTPRAAGTRAALEAAGVYDPPLFVTGEADFASAFETTAALLARSDAPTAIVAGSDDLAAGALAAAHRLGIAVPEQLSIAGFGDAPLATRLWPSLTTVRAPLRALGWNAADLLLGETGDDRRVLAYELVVRDSTAFLNRPA